MKNTGFIVGAYPCAPSFHQHEEAMETDFWRQLADVEGIRGIEQPYLDSLHPYGDEYLFRQLPADWQIVVTGVMETMRRRGSNNGFGLASENEEQRLACVNYYRQVWESIQRTNDRFAGQKILALELQSAPLAGTTNVTRAAECFQTSIAQILSWDWSCELLIEHCDALTQPNARKGFLPLEAELAAAADTPLGICINWARSAIEGRNTAQPLLHMQQCQQANALKALMFSGTTLNGPYGEWQDLHAPFAPFDGAQAGCEGSLLTVALASEMFRQAPLATLSFAGIKLLAIDPQANVQQRIAILQDGVRALQIAAK